MYVQNLSGNGQEVITAGRMDPTASATQQTYNMNIWGWQNGKLVDRTAQWFPNGTNAIVGTEPSVKFADFNGDGKTDMYVSPYTDKADSYGPGLVFLNNGSSFSRVELNFGQVNGHDSAVYDLNKDGYADIFTMGARVSFGSKSGAFTSHTVSGREDRKSTRLNSSH